MDVDDSATNEISNELKLKLEQEAKEYCELSKEKRQSYSTKDDYSYIINRNWLAKWKKYVDYKFIKENSRSYYHSHSFNRKVYQCDPDSFPGDIDNQMLLVPNEEFLNDGDDTNLYNYVIRHDVDQRRDVKILNKKMWDFFSSRYKGGPELKKPFIQDKSRSYSSMRMVELFYRKVNYPYNSYNHIINIFLFIIYFFQIIIITLPDRKNVNDETLEKIKLETIYISRTKSLDDLKEHILNLKKINKFYLEEDEIKNLRLWKFNDNNDSSWKEALEEFSKIKKELNETTEKVNYDKISCLEGNI